MSVLTTNNSEAFLQNLVERHHYTRENTPSNGSSTKEDIVLLEKQGRCSQKLRSSNAMGNLAQVSNMVKGQNTTDISNISNNNSKVIIFGNLFCYVWSLFLISLNYSCPKLFCHRGRKEILLLRPVPFLDLQHEH